METLSAFFPNTIQFSSPGLHFEDSFVLIVIIYCLVQDLLLPFEQDPLTPEKAPLGNNHRVELPQAIKSDQKRKGP